MPLSQRLILAHSLTLSLCSFVFLYVPGTLFLFHSITVQPLPPFIDRDYYYEFATVNQPNLAKAFLAQLDELSYLPQSVDFQMLLSDETLNNVTYFQVDDQGIPQWVEPPNPFDMNRMARTWIMKNRENLGIEHSVSKSASRRKRKKKKAKMKKLKSKRKVNVAENVIVWKLPKDAHGATLNAMTSPDTETVETPNDFEHDDRNVDGDREDRKESDRERAERRKRKKDKKKKRKKKRKKEKDGNHDDLNLSLYVPLVYTVYTDRVFVYSIGSFLFFWR